MKDLIKWINKKLESGSNIEVCISLTDKDIKKLSKHFKITKCPLSYVRFEKFNN